MCESENEEVTRRSAAAEDVGDRFHLSVGHVETVVGS